METKVKDNTSIEEKNNIENKISSYPQQVSQALLALRALILKTAEQEGIANIEEALKWGEPSVISPIGTTIRYDWKEKNPNEYCLYFPCQSKLISTFKALYPETFSYQGNRAIVLPLGQALAEQALSHCLSLALRYKKIKHQL